MGVLPQGGPNPHETDTNSERYTELSQAKNHPTVMGIIGDADVLIGKGFERQFIDAEMELNVAAGDYAYMGNRVGLVKSVTKNGVTGRVETITVLENLGALPLEWREDPAGFGYDENDIANQSTTKTTVYAVAKGVAAEVINGGGVFLGTGSILICKQRTNNMSTWTKEARDLYYYERSQLPKPTSITVSPATSPDKSHNETQQFTAEVLPAEASQDIVWYIDDQGEDVSINQNGLVSIGTPADGTYVVTAKSQVDGTILGTANLVVVL